MGQGRVWTGTQARANGLIDEFGGLEKAIDIAKGLANLPADKDVRRVVFPAPKPFLESLFGQDEDSSISTFISRITGWENSETKAKKALANALPADVRKAFRYVELFEQMKRGEALMILPFELEIR
ncbi:MAG: hypothetical protein LC734_05220 [Acidobacteria bacterium]|nr:hypothetical protein [Acidobacteriota bacterium]